MKRRRENSVASSPSSSRGRLVSPISSSRSHSLSLFLRSSPHLRPPAPPRSPSPRVCALRATTPGGQRAFAGPEGENFYSDPPGRTIEPFRRGYIFSINFDDGRGGGGGGARSRAHRSPVNKEQKQKKRGGNGKKSKNGISR